MVAKFNGTGAIVSAKYLALWGAVQYVLLRRGAQVPLMPRYLDHCRAQGWGGAIVDDHSGPRGRVRLQAGVSWAWIHSDESIMAIAAHVYAPAAADASGQIAEPKQARFLTFGSSIPCRELFHFFSPSQDTISSGPFLGTFPSPWPCGSLHLALCPLSSHASALPRETFFFFDAS